MKHCKNKREAHEHRFAMPFEDIGGGDELHRNKKANKAVLARGREALKLFSIGGLL
ncbi:hypothetical protein IKW75_01315 [Candidatus Saccharibacteria bacterium]|nr:hypothetical protein [Candidatus Saccharibacteria bacterium]